MPTVSFTTTSGLDSICATDSITINFTNMSKVDSFRIDVRRNGTLQASIGNFYGQPSSIKFRPDTTINGMYTYIYTVRFWRDTPCPAGLTASTLATVKDTFVVRYNYFTSLGSIAITPTTGCGGDTVLVNSTASATGFWRDTFSYGTLYYYGAPNPVLLPTTSASTSFATDSFSTRQYIVRRSAVSSCGNYTPNVNFVADTINIQSLANGYAEKVNNDSILIKRVKLGFQYRVYRNNVLYFDTTYGSTPNPDSFFLQNIPSGTYRIEGRDPMLGCNRVIATIIRAIGLPVTFIDFIGYPKTNDSMMLHWSTASEKNTSHFLLQVATESTINQGVFEIVNQVSAVGNSQTRQDYQYTHGLSEKYLYEKILYYRLISVDRDDYSEILKIIVIRRAPHENVWIPFSLDGKNTSNSYLEYHKYSGEKRIIVK